MEKNICVTQNPQDDCSAIVSDIVSSQSNLNHKQLIWSLFNRHKVSYPDGFFEQLGKEDSIELWTVNMDFIFAVGGILDLTSYDIDSLANVNWANLFSRRKKYEAVLVNAITKAALYNETTLNVCDWHIVDEIAAPKLNSFLVRVKMVAPIKIGATHCLIGVTEAKRLDPLIRFLYKSLRSLTYKRINLNQN